MILSNTQLVLFVVGVAASHVFNAVFVAVEFSLVKLRYTRFGTGRMKEARQSEGVAKLLDDMSSSVKLLRFGITVCTMAAGFLLIPVILAISSQESFGSGEYSAWVVAVGFVLAVGLHYIFGELVPRSIALFYPVQAIRVLLPVVQVFAFVSYPFRGPVNWVATGVLRLMRLNPTNDLNLLDVEAQIRSVLSEGDELPVMAESIMSNALELRKRVAYDIMIPRNQLRYFNLEDSLEESLAIARETGHTRFPLCNEDLDHCVGIIHIKDVFRNSTQSGSIDLKRMKRPMLRFPAEEPLERVLQRFLKQKKHFALLRDEFGGTIGAITLEDVLEELVGEIQDEFDNELELMTQIDDDTYVVDGLTPLHDLAEEIGLELTSAEVSTFGGYITLELGRMPTLNEVFRIGNLEITATNVDDRRILSTTLTVLKPEEDEQGEE
ncbi:hemolysin family protein [Puniceicoccaceae bacterium K14]|nr:hemolysin family protein [Puniceicoccaceae bacterium K14]